MLGGVLGADHRSCRQELRAIAVDSKVYERLAGAKNEGESFSRVIDRLLDNEADRFTGSDVLRRLADVSPLSESEADVFVQVVDEARRDEEWGR